MRFSLRKLFVFVTVLCLVLGFFVSGGVFRTELGTDDYSDMRGGYVYVEWRYNCLLAVAYRDYDLSVVLFDCQIVDPDPPAPPMVEFVDPNGVRHQVTTTIVPNPRYPGGVP